MQIKSITSLVLACAFALGTGIAAAAQDDGATGPSGKPLTTQQLRMKNCNAEARAQSLKGDERKAFMSTCLKGGAKDLAAREESKPAATPSPAQAKRKACSAEAKAQGLKGDERKAFVDECVSEDELALAH
ncbi:MAG TPA: PsiF family protein [Dokdonella sp.]